MNAPRHGAIPVTTGSHRDGEEARPLGPGSQPHDLSQVRRRAASACQEWAMVVRRGNLSAMRAASPLGKFAGTPAHLGIHLHHADRLPGLVMALPGPAACVEVPTVSEGMVQRMDTGDVPTCRSLLAELDNLSTSRLLRCSPHKPNRICGMATVVRSVIDARQEHDSLITVLLPD